MKGFLLGIYLSVFGEIKESFERSDRWQSRWPQWARTRGTIESFFKVVQENPSHFVALTKLDINVLPPSQLNRRVIGKTNNWGQIRLSFTLSIV